MTPYPPEIENLDRIRRELLDGMNRIDRIRKKRMGETGGKLKLSCTSFTNHPAHPVHPVYFSSSPVFDEWLPD